VGISRIDQPEKNNHGYYVRLTRQGEQYAKFFSDKRYGGKRKAKKAAKEFLEELEAELPPVNLVGIKSVRNKSGYVGVNRTKSTSRGHTYEYWQAFWNSGGVRRSAKFSINKYGAREAKKLAIAARKQWAEEFGEPE
jgi:hypothetical protein